MKVFYLYISLIFLISSCGGGITPSAQIDNIKIGEELAISSKVSSEEVLYARHLCDKLRSKRMRIMSQSVFNSYDIKLNTTSCSGNSTTQLTKVKISSDSQYKITGEYGLFNKYVETDLDGHIANVCTEIFAGLTPILTNYVSTTEVVQIKFEADNRFAVVYATKGQGSNYITTDVEVYSFDIVSADKYMGANISYVKKGQCTDPNSKNKTYEKEQIIQ